MSDDATMPPSPPPFRTPSDRLTPPGHADPSRGPYEEAVVDLLGAVAYGELTGFSELAADAAAAPTMGARITMSRLAARELGHYERLAERLREVGAEPEVAMAPFMPALDAYHARTQGTTWPERLVKAYVGDGIRTDFYKEISAHLDPTTASLVDEVSAAPDDRDEALVAGVLRAVEADPVIEGRLALWGRRLMGEALSQAQQVTVERDALASLLVGGLDGRGADLAELGRIMTRMGENHVARMVRLGLAA